jgi:drug/metabolite transporter (DMT)-like permease
MKMRSKGMFYAFLAVFLWGTMGTTIKLIVTKVDSFTVAVYTGLFATIALFLYLIMTKKTKELIKELKKHYLFFVIVGIIGLGVQQIFYLKAFQLLPASQVVIIFYLYPLFMIILSGLILKEKTSLTSMFFVLLGFFGVYILVSNGTFIKLYINNGLIFTLFASLSWGLFSVLIKLRKVNAEISMFLFNLFGLIFLIALVPLFGFNCYITLTETLGILYLALIPTALAFVLWNKALHLTRTSICSNISLLTPLFSLVIISLVLKEKINFNQVIGLVIILGSVFLNINFENKQKDNLK